MEISEKLLPTPEAKNQEGYQVSNGKQYPRLGKCISSQEGFLANPLVTQEKEKEQKMTASSGQKCLELFNSQNRAGLSLKMCADYLLSSKGWYSNKCALTWKAQATKCNRLLFLLSPSTRHTAGIGFGLLPTATTQEVEHPKAQINQRGRRIAKNGNTHSIGLADTVGMIPTPQARDGRRTGYKGRDDLDSLVEIGKTKHKVNELRNPSGMKTGLKLQPNFVEWMMGFPQNWTDLNYQNQPTEKKD